MNIDPWILSFSAVTVIVTIWMGFRSAKTSKTASDFFVAGRSVGVGMNASAISGEYLSAASFMGVAGMVMSSGYDALWYPVCYACGYLFLLLFIAGPLRRFGAYTIPDFAEGRFDSPLFRKIAVIFVLFIGFFYTMPQMKGAGTTLAYIFDKVDLRGVMPDFMLAHDKAGIALIGLPYWVGVALVGAVITLNVALGGMKGITLVQAIQYWIKMFAISVPIFVLMSVYGNYGKQLDATGKSNSIGITVTREGMGETEPWISKTGPGALHLDPASIASPMFLEGDQISFVHAVEEYNYITGKEMTYIGWMTNLTLKLDLPAKLTVAEYTAGLEKAFAAADLKIMFPTATNLYVVPASRAESLVKMMHIVERKPLPEKAPADQKWISPISAR